MMDDEDSVKLVCPPWKIVKGHERRTLNNNKTLKQVCC